MTTEEKVEDASDALRAGVLDALRSELQLEGTHLALGDATETVSGDLVSGTFFQVLGLRPAAGRLFTAEDDRTPGGHPVLVLSHDLWQRRFGGDPQAVGRTLRLNGTPLTVVGVAPPGFHGVKGWTQP